jgi:hypothetical protein
MKLIVGAFFCAHFLKITLIVRLHYRFQPTSTLHSINSMDSARFLQSHWKSF